MIILPDTPRRRYWPNRQHGESNFMVDGGPGEQMTGHAPVVRQVGNAAVLVLVIVVAAPSEKMVASPGEK
jgi:hypothetical protein